ncbi:MAG: carbohydrate ABC transporter substrate-binding protein [Oscillospiraceae bacterium]
MCNLKKAAASVAAVVFAASALTACGEEDSEHGYLMAESETTPPVTVAINTETLAPEQEEQVADLADTLTDMELENKTIKWMSFYDPWHPTGQGNSKPVSVELFEKKYGGVIEYYPTTWANQYSDLSTYVLSGEGIDFFPASEAVPKCVISGMTQSYDEYVNWESPLWDSVRDLNDKFAVGGEHYLMACQATEGYVVYYNRQTIEENGFEDPKTLYENGEWTMEKFKDMLTDFVDNDNGMYGLDGWFNCTPLYLASGVPTISLENGKIVSNLGNSDLERAMTFQYELNRNGLILDKALFNWSPQIQFMGEGKELFYIGGLYEIEQSPDIWTLNFGAAEDVFFVPIPRDEQADKYYYNAEIDCYNLCVGAGNPEGVARLMECIIASYSDENAQAISDQKHIDDFGWTDEMIEMRNEVRRLTKENPVRDIYGGLPNDISTIISDAISQPLNGTDWYSVRESITDAVDAGIEEANAKISS